MSSNEEAKKDENENGKRHGHRCHRRRFWKIPFIIAFIVLAKSALVMLLWNGLIPNLFHGPIVTYGQALGLTVLAHLLVGFRPFGPPGRHFMHHHHLRERWANLSPEEKEKLRSEMHSRWGKR
jgi:hypothetical protein